MRTGDVRGDLLQHGEQSLLRTAAQSSQLLTYQQLEQRADVVEPPHVPHRASEVQPLHHLVQFIEPGYLQSMHQDL